MAALLCKLCKTPAISDSARHLLIRPGRYIGMFLNANQRGLLSMMTGFEIVSKRTRKRIFLEEMDQVVPWDALVDLIAPHHPKSSTGSPPFGIEVLLRIYCLQQWFGLSEIFH